ncbi:Lustrin cysteine-rich repeated [Trinorchestia longiramus]|nr:Lustrin cysteine-rich repeated [Trinorchestia longiramus]
MGFGSCTDYGIWDLVPAWIMAYGIWFLHGLRHMGFGSSTDFGMKIGQKAASLLSLCPLGAPLMIGDAEDRPFLCGDGPNGPACPTLYKCHVSEGHDYGVCCADVDRLVKPGSCPVDASAAPGSSTPTSPPSGREEDSLLTEVVPEDAEELRCGVSCSHDLQCPSTQKCCLSDICGQHCIQPANLTGVMMKLHDPGRFDGRGMGGELTAYPVSLTDMCELTARRSNEKQLVFMAGFEPAVFLHEAET